MLRGIHKNMICVHPPQSRYFEAVWFVLRSDYRREASRDRDMIREAGRILADSEKRLTPPKKGKALGRNGRGGLLFLAGLGCGAGALLLLWLLLFLLRLL